MCGVMFTIALLYPVVYFIGVVIKAFFEVGGFFLAAVATLWIGILIAPVVLWVIVNNARDSSIKKLKETIADDQQAVDSLNQGLDDDDMDDDDLDDDNLDDDDLDDDEEENRNSQSVDPNV